MAISAFVLFLNLHGFYLGKTILGLDMDSSSTNALFQVIAKFQELLIVGSLTSIVLSYIRNELIKGDGVPLGFLCSSFSFASANHFWSEEFWGGVWSGGMRKRKKAFTIVLLVMCGGIAVLAGPSIAVLLIPRKQDWVAGETDFYLRGTMDDIFPTTLAASSRPSRPDCSDSDPSKHGVCMSGGYYSLLLFTSRIPGIENKFNMPPLPKVIFGIFDTQVVEIAGSSSSMPPYELWGSIRGVACQTSVVGPLISALMFQGYLSMDWGLLAGNKSDKSPSISAMSGSKYKYYFEKTLKTESKVPVVRVACARAQSLGEDKKSITFPIIPEFACPIEGEIKALEVPSIPNKRSAKMQISWTPLPSDFGSTSTGMIFQAPWAKDGTRAVVGCSVDARWADGKLNGIRGNPTKSASSENWGRQSNLDPPFRPKDSKTWARIRLENSWLDKLTPLISTSKAKSISTIAAILGNSAIVGGLPVDKDQAAVWNDDKMGRPNRTIYLEWVTSMIIADGLSRYGLETSVDGNGKLLDYHIDQTSFPLILEKKPVLNPPQGPYTTFKYRITLSGLNYKIKNALDVVFFAVLSLHLFLALAHSARIVYMHRTSEAWDSITELLTLAYNSFPAARGLRHTSSGIRSFRTYKIMATVRSNGIVETEEDGPKEADGQVELLFKENGRPSAPDEQASLHDNSAASIERLPPGYETGMEIDDRSMLSLSSQIPLIHTQSGILSPDTGLRSRRTSQATRYEKVKIDRLYS